MKKKFKKYIIAKGEFTGHRHLLEAVEDTGCFDIVKQAEQVLVEFIKGNTELNHQEHKEILFLQGTRYRQYGLREVDPFENEIRAVRD